MCHVKILVMLLCHILNSLYDHMYMTIGKLARLSASSRNKLKVRGTTSNYDHKRHFTCTYKITANTIPVSGVSDKVKVKKRQVIHLIYRHHCNLQ